MTKINKAIYYCPVCSEKLVSSKIDLEKLICQNCDQIYGCSNGFFIFDNSKMVNLKNYKLDISVLNIENVQLLDRLNRWLLKHISDIKGKKILSIGCGGGSDIIELNKLGAEAYGMDFTYRTIYWNNKKYSNKFLFVSSMDLIPFPDNYFDLILCFGVIEHVYEDLYFSNQFKMLDKKRNAFLKSINKALKPNGELILSSPNRNFPLDFQHNHNFLKALKFLDGTYISLHLHSPFNKFLESYSSIEKHFQSIGDCQIIPMDLDDFFGFSIFSDTPMLRIFHKIFMLYIKLIDKLPFIIRKSFFNPYLIVKIIKK